MSVRHMSSSASTLGRGTVARRVADFLDMICANSHTSWGGIYANTAAVINMCTTTGINILRDDCWSGNQTPYASYLAAGIKLNLITLGPTINLATDVSFMTSFIGSHPGGIYAYEGPNEYNSQQWIYNGVDSRTAPLTWGQNLQANISSTVRAQSSLNSVLLCAPSLSTGPPQNYGFTFGSTADVVPQHIYSLNAEQVVGRVASGVTAGAASSNGHRVWFTETGANDVWGGVFGCQGSQQGQGTTLLNDLYECFRQGVERAYIYLLADTTIFGDYNDKWGLYDSAGNPKLIASFMANQRTILNDAGGTARTFTPGRLSYTLTNMPGTATSLLFAKSDGVTFFIVLYNGGAQIVNQSTGAYEPPAPVNVTVNFSPSVASYSYYWPANIAQGTTPVASGTNAASVTLALGGDPILLKVSKT